MSKTKEEILEEVASRENPEGYVLAGKERIEEWLDAYAAQCVQEFKEKLKNEIEQRKSKLLSPERYQGMQLCIDIINEL